MTDVRTLHTLALSACTAVVVQVDRDHLHHRTPCAGWDLGALLAHMIGQNHGFAVAAKGGEDGPDRWLDRPVTGDVAAEWSVSADTVRTAFASVDLANANILVPEISSQPLPAARAIGAHTVDTVVHGWDVAASIGVQPAFDPGLLTEVLAMVERIPDGPARSGADPAFRPAIRVPAHAPVLDRIVAYLGRQPDWPETAAAH